MANASQTTTPSPSLPMPALEPGDRLDQRTFHARYEAMPSGTRAELIGGIVHMPSPMKRLHSRFQGHISWWLNEYEFATPGVESGHGITSILSEESEPQPDACLYILAEKGGQSRFNDGEYLEGAPELIVEIASSTESIDLHGKKWDYEQSGVREYVVIALRQQAVFWFSRQDGKYADMAAGEDGILRSLVFPGLWLDPEALLRFDRQRIREVLHRGLASPEHVLFVERLREARTHE